MYTLRDCPSLVIRNSPGATSSATVPPCTKRSAFRQYASLLYTTPSLLSMLCGDMGYRIAPGAYSTPSGKRVANSSTMEQKPSTWAAAMPVSPALAS